jgi:hypothetical protein
LVNQYERRQYIKLRDYVEENREKQKGMKQKKGRNKVKLCRKYNGVLLLYLLDPEKAQGCLVSPNSSEIQD